MLPHPVTKSALTLFIVIIALELWFLLHFIHRIVSDNRYQLSQKVRHLFGVNPHKSFHKMRLIQLAAYLVLILATGPVTINSTDK